MRPAEAAGAEAVAVEADAEDEIHAIPGHDDALEAEDGADGEAEAAPLAGDAAMKDAKR